MTDKEPTHHVNIGLPLWFYNQLLPLINGIEVNDFAQLVRISLRKYQLSAQTPSPSAPPPPFSEPPSLTPPLISPKGDIYPPLNVSPSKKEAKPRAKRKRISYSPEFREFWLLYPYSRGNKAKAFQEFKDIIAAGSTTESDLIAGARCYAKRCKRDRTEPKYVKSPELWLRDERWNDEDKSGSFTALPELKENPNQEAPVWLD